VVIVCPTLSHCCIWIFRFWSADVTFLTSAIANEFSKVWKSTSISNETKVKLYETFIVPVLLYGSECWCLRREDERRILTAEMTWLRRLLRVRRRDKMRNETAWYSMSRNDTRWQNSRAKTKLGNGHVSMLHSYGKRRQGRQPKKWMDNVDADVHAKKFWCGTETNGSIKFHWNDGREQKRKSPIATPCLSVWQVTPCLSVSLSVYVSVYISVCVCVDILRSLFVEHGAVASLWSW